MMMSSRFLNSRRSKESLFQSYSTTSRCDGGRSSSQHVVVARGGERLNSTTSRIS